MMLGAKKDLTAPKIWENVYSNLITCIRDGHELSPSTYEFFPRKIKDSHMRQNHQQPYFMKKSAESEVKKFLKLCLFKNIFKGSRILGLSPLTSATDATDLWKMVVVYHHFLCFNFLKKSYLIHIGNPFMTSPGSLFSIRKGPSYLVITGRIKTLMKQPLHVSVLSTEVSIYTCCKLKILMFSQCAKEKQMLSHEEEMFSSQSYFLMPFPWKQDFFPLTSMTLIIRCLKSYKREKKGQKLPARFS